MMNILIDEIIRTYILISFIKVPEGVFDESKDM